MRKVFSHTCVLVALLGLLMPPALYSGTNVVEVRSGVPRFTLEEAILTALQRNPDIQRARQEIERTKGVYIELRADVLPRVDMNGFYQNTDPQLGTVSSGGG